MKINVTFLDGEVTKQAEVDADNYAFQTWGDAAYVHLARNGPHGEEITVASFRNPLAVWKNDDAEAEAS